MTSALVLASLLSASLSAQSTQVQALQGDASLRTTGGWVHPAAPRGNPFPQPPTAYSRDKVALGKALFWDEQVSTSNTVACGTCHIPEAGGIDPRIPARTVNALGQPVFGSFGVVPQSSSYSNTLAYGHSAPPSSEERRLATAIHAPTMIGAYVFRNQFWDRRAGPMFFDGLGNLLFSDWASLENQAVEPPLSEIEMGHQNLAWSPVGTSPRVLEHKLDRAAPLALATPGTVPSSIPVSWLMQPYAIVFDNVFAADPDATIARPQGVTRERFAMAVASYMRTLVPDGAPIDRGTMTREELLGFDLFVRSGCVRCHSASGSPTLRFRGGGGTGSSIGVLNNAWDNAFSNGQPENIFISNPARDAGFVKVPTLRNVGLRRRFFHDGRGRIVGGLPQNSIADIVDFYDIDQDPTNGGPGGGLDLVGNSGPDLTPVERDAVIAFLSNALTDPRVAAAAPPFDRPELYSERVPFGSNLTRPATSLFAAWTPRMIADVPPLAEKVGGPGIWKLGVSSRDAGIGAPQIPMTSFAVLFFGVADTGAAPIYVTPALTITVELVDSRGFATAQQPVPLTASLIGVRAYFQWIVADPTISQFGFSESARLSIF